MDLPALAMPQELAWPAAAMLGWWLGEWGYQRLGLPRVSVYGLLGFVLGASQLGVLPSGRNEGALLMANMAFGLVLFEFGYRINLRWLLSNRWLTLTGLLESSFTFMAVLWLSVLSGLAMLPAAVVAALAMATSPAALLRTVNERHCSGQVTERALHLSALNCVLALLVFNTLVGVWTFQSSGSWLRAGWNSVVMLLASSALGASLGVLVPGLLRGAGRLSEDTTVVFALGVLLLVALAHGLRLSPVLAALSFGLMARHRRVALNRTQRGFGALGDLLTVLLFMFAASLLVWHQVLDGLLPGLALVGVRLLSKLVAVVALARPSGLSLRKGGLTALALTPISVFVILLLEQARLLGVDLLDQVAPLTAAILLAEVLGPLVAARALQWAGETTPEVAPLPRGSER
ncbi:MAG: cation:proton antiporter [Burkholderiales bacterium]|nr:cation:proton antiporter [Burkholderiales bacterium]